MSSTPKQPAEAVKDLRAEWRQAKADQSSPADLNAIEVLGRAAVLIDQTFGWGAR